MTFEQIAQQAMDYLDSVGMAAEWSILRASNALLIETDCLVFSYYSTENLNLMMVELECHYPQKSPA